MTVPALEISHATRSFAERRALQDVSLAVGSGEIVALLGPNGAGKTTLMRAAAGRLQLDQGTARVAGQDPVAEADARRALGIVPQSIALYPQLTARQNLDVFARLMGLKGRAVAAAVEEGLARASLADRAGDLLGALSGGMQRRLNIVAGALHSPSLLLLDEPTVGVDISAREGIHALLRDLRDGGMGILFSTHDFEQAASMADRVAFMHEGRLLREGRVVELVQGVFGESRELLVTLQLPAAEPHQAVLRDLQLLPNHDLRLWSGPLSGGMSALEDIEALFAQAGLAAAEIRLRAPGLDGVFLHLTSGERSA